MRLLKIRKVALSLVVLLALGCGKKTESAATRNADPVVKNLGLNFDDFDTAIYHNSHTKKGFMEFGGTFYDNSGEAYTPCIHLQYKMPVGKPIYSMVDGAVTSVTEQSTDDYEITIAPQGGEDVWNLIVDHLRSPKVTKGQTVKAGDQLGETMSHYLEIDFFNFSDKKDYCPYAFFDSTVASSLKKKIEDHMTSWEAVHGDIYNQAAMITPGCVLKSVLYKSK